MTLAMAAGALLHGCGGGETIDLTAHVDRAEVRRETPLIDIGTTAARAHLTAGWGIEEQWTDSTFAWSLGEASTIEFFVATPRPLQLTMRGWPLPFPGLRAQTVRVSLNDTALGKWVLRPGQREYRLALPAAQLRRGVNRLQLAYSKTRRPIDLDPTSNDPRRLAAGWDWLRLDGLDDGSGAEVAAQDGAALLRLPTAGELSIYLDLPDGARLEIERILASGDGAAVPLQVDAMRDDGVALAAVTLAVPRELGAQSWTLRGSGPTRLRFRSTDPTRRVTLVSPRLRLPRAPGGATTACADTPARAAQQPPVIIYLVDTLRADHLGCHGYPLPITPHIDAFARDAVRFANGVGQSSWTKPSVASLFTGLTPLRHGVLHTGDSLRAVPTLADLLGAAGYQTAAVITNSIVGAHSGFDRGFATYDELPELPVTARPELPGDTGDFDHQNAAELHRRAFTWLDQRRPGPFLLYLHASDPHAPYLPAEPFHQQFAPGAELRLGLSSHLREVAARPSTTAPERRALIALYDAEIAYLDSEFGALLAGLKQRGLYDAALIVLLADHGEAFDEHQRWSHATSLYGEQLNVPLLIKFPAQWRAGSVVSAVAQHADVLPTVLHTAGLEPPADLTGRNLLPEIGCPSAPHPPVAAYSQLEGPEANRLVESLVLGRHKLIHHVRVGYPQRRVELYALDDDPGEARDLSQALPITSGYLLSRMAPFRVAPSDAPAPARTLEPAVAERLRALGYVP